MAYYYDIDPKTLAIDSGRIEDDGEPGSCGCRDDCDCGESARFNEDGFEGIHSESRQSVSVARQHALDECVRLRDGFDACIRALLAG